MNQKFLVCLYNLVAIGTVCLDQLTKKWALAHVGSGLVVNRFLSFDLEINRGISWGMLHTSSFTGFVLITTLIVAVTVAVAVHAYGRWLNNQNILGETLVVAGSSANIIDRILYGGVIDFIHIAYQRYSWPIFNVADMTIVVGVFVMLWSNYQQE